MNRKVLIRGVSSNICMKAEQERTVPEKRLAELGKLVQAIGILPLMN